MFFLEFIDNTLLDFWQKVTNTLGGWTGKDHFSHAHYFNLFFFFSIPVAYTSSIISPSLILIISDIGLSGIFFGMIWMYARIYRPKQRSDTVRSLRHDPMYFFIRLSYCFIFGIATFSLYVLHFIQLGRYLHDIFTDFSSVSLIVILLLIAEILHEFTPIAIVYLVSCESQDSGKTLFSSVRDFFMKPSGGSMLPA